jgi:hypothetical protein
MAFPSRRGALLAAAALALTLIAGCVPFVPFI